MSFLHSSISTFLLGGYIYDLLGTTTGYYHKIYTNKARTFSITAELCGFLLKTSL